MCYLNAITASCFKCDERESADGYFCFTLEHDVSRQTLLMRLLQRMLSSAQCLAGGPFEFFFGRAKWSCGLARRGGKAPFIGCFKIDSELFHQLGALANAFASRQCLTRLYGLMESVPRWSASPSNRAGNELKTLRSAHEPRRLADDKCCAGDRRAEYGVRGPVRWIPSGVARGCGSTIRTQRAKRLALSASVHYQRPVLAAGWRRAKLESEIVALHADTLGDVECFAQHVAADLH
jgi:hypothetical protein